MPRTFAATGCHPAEWIETLKKLMTIEAAAIVPGHGPLLRDWDHAKKVIGVLETVRAQVKEAVRQGLTAEQTLQRIDLTTWRKTFAGDDLNRGFAFDDFFARSAVNRAWQEAKGTITEE